MEEKKTILQTLGFVSDKSLIQKVLEFSISEVRGNDISLIYSSFADNPKGCELAWEFIKSRWDNLQYFGDGQYLLANLIKSCITYFTPPNVLEDIRDFFEERSLLGDQRILLKCAKIARHRSSSFNSNKDLIQFWLNENNY